MSPIIFKSQIERYSAHWVPRGGCSCGRYAFYLECGHLSEPPRLRRCGRRVNRNGTPVICYSPAPLVNVYSVTINGRCWRCLNGD